MAVGPTLPPSFWSRLFSRVRILPSAVVVRNGSIHNRSQTGLHDPRGWGDAAGRQPAGRFLTGPGWPCPGGARLWGWESDTGEIKRPLSEQTCPSASDCSPPPPAVEGGCSQRHSAPATPNPLAATLLPRSCPLFQPQERPEIPSGTRAAPSSQAQLTRSPCISRKAPPGSVAFLGDAFPDPILSLVSDRWLSALRMLFGHTAGASPCIDARSSRGRG